ncbi:DUF2793 domain-containing protein [Neptunicoccus sediminis]|uniref:DUF2793 domain-containing protein n=1 Tax=Neptunicoccus sediminis TaxID=1892596 RepID=UPI000845C08F|nr:DUF2793 domain-containing protein [Neptunicoccus sediminis]
MTAFPDTSPILGLPYILSAQAQKHVTHNESIRMLDLLVQLTVISRTITSPPASPAIGDCYVVPAPASGDWEGQEGALAVWQGTAWAFTPPQAGWRAYALDEAAGITFDGSVWGNSVILQNLSGLGINTASDATNPLAVSGDATLLSHDGAGHQLKINKAGSSDTASLLYQSNWSGRAEMGLAGDDSFRIKVSADGSSFDTALSFDPASATTQAKCLSSGKLTVAADNVGLIDTPGAGGFVLITVVHATYPQSSHSGIFCYDTGGSLACDTIYTGSSFANLGTAVLDGTTGSVNTSSIAVKTGQLQIENRYTNPWTYSYTFIGGL